MIKKMIDITNKKREEYQHLFNKELCIKRVKNIIFTKLMLKKKKKMYIYSN